MGITLTGYGGVGEIGGNAFLLDDGRDRIFLDLGKRFGSDPQDELGPRPGWNDYYDSFLQPRGHSLVGDLMRLGIIPDLPQLYRQDRGGASGPSPVDAVVVSHAHMDHCGLLGLLRPDLPVWMSPGSRATLESLQATGSGVLSEYLAARPKGVLPRKDGAPGKGTNWKDPETRAPVAAARPVQPGDGDVGAWHLRHLPVDHSIHGARATILEGPATVVYTGDFRMHGRDAEATRRFVAAAGGADVLVAEGTRVSRTERHAHAATDAEVQVEAEIEGLLDRHKDGFVGVSFPPRDLDRFLSIHNVARRAGRRVVVPAKLAHLLDAVRPTDDRIPDPRRDPHIAIHAPVRSRGVGAMPPGVLRMPTADLRLRDAAVDDETWRDLWRADHEPWALPYVEAENAVTSTQVAREPQTYLFSISYWSIGELFDIFPHDGRPPAGGLYIHSMTQPFNDEMEISDRKLRRWLAAFRLERHDTHVSGHLSASDLEWVLDELRPRRLVPVHSEAPDLTADRYRARTGQEALIPEPGKPLPVG